MSVAFRKRALQYSVAAMVLSGVALQANARQPASAADGQTQGRVQAALQADPYFYDAHVNVSIEHGNVVLKGFVFSDWDLRDAMRIASKAAGNARVIDDLSIVTGGRR